MTNRRRLLVFGLLAGLLVLGVGAWLLWSQSASTAIRVLPFSEWILGTDELVSNRTRIIRVGPIEIVTTDDLP